jgi:hypothetical protein
VIIRIVSGEGMKTIEIDDVVQVIVFADSGEPVACAHENSQGVIIASSAGDSGFDKTLVGLGVKPVPVDFLEK